MINPLLLFVQVIVLVGMVMMALLALAMWSMHSRVMKFRPTCSECGIKMLPSYAGLFMHMNRYYCPRCNATASGLIIRPEPKTVRATRERTTTHSKQSTGLRGSFPLDEKTIDAEVIVPSSPGVYALGHLKANTFIIQHIGHSETDLKAQLKGYIGKYDRFKYEYADSPQTAIDKEREVYYALDRTRRP